jgi:hypothetical protein
MTEQLVKTVSANVTGDKEIDCLALLKAVMDSPDAKEFDPDAKSRVANWFYFKYGFGAN